MFLGGHSYGGRQATMLCAAEPGLVDGLLLLSYPLHPPQRPAELRTAHFPALRTPALFVSGAHDGFGSIDELAAALQLIPARTELLPIAGAGHELLTKKNRDTLPRLVVEAFRSFAARPAA
jgi:predicted alpha/beta-hydrolase family hydrolase